MSSSYLSGFEASDLIQKGWAVFDINPTLVEKAAQEAQAIIVQHKDQPEAQRAFMRCGEDELDMGLIRRDGTEGTDNKFFLHYTHDLLVAGAPGLRGETMPALAALMEHNVAAVQEILRVLCSKYSEHFPADIIDKFAGTVDCPLPYCAPTIRALLYQSLGETLAQGAKTHLDRSFITLHMGDEGGQLLAYRDEYGNGEQVISPPPGQVVVFFGVKVYALTKGAIEPLWHGSRTEPGADRKALVQFNHVPIGKPVTDARTTYRQLQRVHGAGD